MLYCGDGCSHKMSCMVSVIWCAHTNRVQGFLVIQLEFRLVKEGDLRELKYGIMVGTRLVSYCSSSKGFGRVCFLAFKAVNIHITQKPNYLLLAG